MKTIVAVSFVVSLGCVTPAATFSLPRERATECVEHCNTLEMKLGAVVIMKNAAGCVCEPREQPATTSASERARIFGAAAAAVITDEEEQSRQQNR